MKIIESRIKGKNAPVNPTEMEKFLRDIDFEPPLDYVYFMTLHNGAEGPIGSDAYLYLWPIEELVSLNTDLEVSLYAPGFFIFGSDGGGAAFAFNKKTGEIVEFGLIGMLINDEPKVISSKFVEFVEYLYNFPGK